MNKSILWLIIFVLSINIVLATNFTYYNNRIDNLSIEKYYGYKYLSIDTKEMRAQAKELKAESVEETIMNTENFVSKIKWEFYYHPRDIDTVFEEMKGDCTDISQLQVQLLRANGIYSRSVHGWVIINGEYSKHDWTQILWFNNNSTYWYNDDPYFFSDELIYRGYGVW